jgi:SAM-dependent methyltransferase
MYHGQIQVAVLQSQNGQVMRVRDPATRYFEDVYPFLRGATGANLATCVTRRMTEPGQLARLAWVLDAIGNGTPLRILDAGCGQGKFAVALARRGHSVTGVDLSPAMLRASRLAAEQAGVSAGVRFELGDIRTWTPSETYDAVLCIGVAEYYPEVSLVLRRLFEWTESRFLFSLSRSRTGIRNSLRKVWLGSQGVCPGSFDAPALAGLLCTLPGTCPSILETAWAYCVCVDRPRSVAHDSPVDSRRAAVPATR